MIKLQSRLAATAAALLLAACGGGSDSSPEVPAEDPTVVPTSATTSTSTWFKFASALAPTDAGEALSMGAITELPTSETEEAMALPQ